MARMRRPRTDNDEETIVPSLAVTLGYPIPDGFTTYGPYVEVVIAGCELRGRVDTLHTVLIARWDSQVGRWTDGEDVVQPTIIIAPLQLDEEVP